MSTDNIGFHEDMAKIIFQLSSNMHLICFSDKVYVCYHTCDISLFRRELPIFCLFLRKSPYENFQNFLYILYISLFGISDLPTKIQEFPSLFNHSPYLEKKISLFVFWDVSHVCMLLIFICAVFFSFLQVYV